MDDTQEKKARYYAENCSYIHIKLNNGFFRNGYIEAIKEDHLILREKKLGLMPVFFKEIIDITPFNEPGEMK